MSHAQRLYINIDHVATIRQARRGHEPIPVDAVSICEQAGADGITAHLREDRRHMQDADIDEIAIAVTTVFNLEIAATDEMISLAERLRPHQVTIVPEKREEVTTEGGLDVDADPARLERILRRLAHAGIRTSLFIDADPGSTTRSRDLGAHAVEFHTGRYAHAPADPSAIAALRECAALGASLGLAIHAGHGLTTDNVGLVAAIPEVEELNIGHHVVSRAVFVGLDRAVRELRAAMDAARGGA
ncbi:MAG: pyridoxine 5'-phosphate synthase [Gemmatimonadaceae bacterium]